MEPTFTFKAKIWLWQGKGAWHFISLPTKLSKQIKGFQGPRRGFGSVRVKVTIGKTTWKTSIFPSKEGHYILPLKADVRKKENLLLDQTVNVEFSLE
jgi:hypothetical protein